MQEIINKALQICELPNLNGRDYRRTCAKSIIYRELHSIGYTLTSIANHFGVTHSTVINLLQKYDDRLKYDKEFKDLVDRYYGNKR